MRNRNSLARLFNQAASWQSNKGFFWCQWACENWSSLEQTIQFQGYAEACGSPSHVLPRLFDEGGKPQGQYLDSLDSKDGGWSPLTINRLQLEYSGSFTNQLPVTY